MHSSSLRGVFPEPSKLYFALKTKVCLSCFFSEPLCKRNFIKENMRQIKVMQGLVKDSTDSIRTPDRSDKYRNKPPKVVSNTIPLTKSQSNLAQSQSHVPRLHKLTDSTKNIHRLKKSKCKTESRFSEMAVQTEHEQDLKKLYSSGPVIYPSPEVLKSLKRSPRRPSQDRGDTKNETDELTNRVDNMCLGDKDYVKENILALKQKAAKRDIPEEANKLPAKYQKGVVPKYLKDRKEELGRYEEVDPECPPGHVLLPEDERKETLRVLRQSTYRMIFLSLFNQTGCSFKGYADRIQELNTMPVRNDTLRMRRRKMEIEEELKKIDEGIKVFQRAKVFVKTDA